MPKEGAFVQRREAGRCQPSLSAPPSTSGPRAPSSGRGRHVLGERAQVVGQAHASAGAALIAGEGVEDESHTQPYQLHLRHRDGLRRGT